MNKNEPTAPVALIGVGNMGREYARVLKALGHEFSAHGRGEESAAAFAGETGVRPSTGDLGAQFALRGGFPDTAVVAVTTDSLAPVVALLLKGGTRRILVEKPGGLTPEEVEGVARLDQHDRVLVAYNRRFYPSVAEARRMIAEDGGVTSFAFEFTELADRIGKTHHAPPLKETWFFGNSTHVVDLAFFLAGAGADPAPIRFDANLVAGQLDWHPAAARFAGCGEVGNGILFSYRADWESGGRWAIEMNTPVQRLMLAPLETLQIQRRGEFGVHHVTSLAAEPLEGCKPGLAEMTQSFLSELDDPRFLTLRDQAARLKMFSRMLYAGKT